MKGFPDDIQLVWKLLFYTDLKNRHYTGNQQTLALTFLKANEVINAFFVINKDVLLAFSGK